jgi:hypothetical protein
MGFRCDFCNQAQPVRTKPVNIITKIRKQEGKVKMINGMEGEWIQGWQIAEEKKACRNCAKKNVVPTVLDS